MSVSELNQVNSSTSKVGALIIKKGGRNKVVLRVAVKSDGNYYCQPPSSYISPEDLKGEEERAWSKLPSCLQPQLMTCNSLQMDKCGV